MGENTLVVYPQIDPDWFKYEENSLNVTQNDSSATTMGMEEHQPILWDSSRMRTQSTEDNTNHDPDLSHADRVRSHAPDRPWCALDVSGLLPGEPRMLSDL